MAHQEQLLLYILGIQILAVMTPGPDFVLSFKNATTSGNRVYGLMTALGLTTGMTIQALVSLFILNKIMNMLPTLIAAIKWIGAGYLIWLGVNSLWSLKKPQYDWQNNEAINRSNLVQYYIQGLVCNITNPKAILYYVSLFVFLLKQQNLPYLLLVSIIAIIFTTGILWFGGVAWFFSREQCQRYVRHFHFYAQLLLGVILITFAVVMLAVQV